jgi:hypothetical protein
MVFPFKSIHDNEHLLCPIKNQNHSDDCSSKDGSSSISIQEGSTRTESVRSNNRTKRTLIIDETLLPPDEAERLLAKRAYNRECADRARKRSKRLTEELKDKIKELQADKDELRRTIATIEKEFRLVQNEHRELLLKELQRTTNINTGSLCPSDVIHYDPMGTSSTMGLNVLSTRNYPFPPSLYSPGIGGGSSGGELSKLTPSWEYNRAVLQRRRS